MGRQSSTGLPFLVERPDTHKFSYHRVLPKDLAPLITGPVHLAWTSKVVTLEGRAAIKISFSTGDRKTAESRWLNLHHQVEALIQAAQAKIRAQQDAEFARRVTALQPSEIRQMAAQVHHDLLAEDDRMFSDPNFKSPLAGVISSLLLDKDRARAEEAGYDPRFLAQDMMRKKAQNDLKRRNLSSYFQSIEEGEADVSPALIAKLGTLTVGQNNQDVLNEDEVGALNQKPAQTTLIPSAVDALLGANGISLPPDHQDKSALALAMLRAEMNAHKIIEARRSGDPTETPERPAPVRPAQEKETGKTISQMRERWIELIKPAKKTRDDNKKYLDYFIDLNGDIRVKQITKKVIRDFRDELAKRPRNMPRKIAQLPLQDQIAWGLKHPDRPLLSRRTVNAKGIGSLSVLLQIAVDEDHIESNPCARQFFKLRKGDTLEILPYSVTDLNKIFSSPVYKDGARWVAGAGEAAFWFAPVGLFAGAREEEIGQLLVADIKVEEGITYFDFIEFDDEADTEGIEGEDKHIKTEAGRRKVPVHPVLIELGFLRYVAQMKARGFKYLFPGLKAYRGRRTQNWSKWWSRYADEYVTKSPHKVFHSLRHAFLDRMRNVFGNDETARPLAGHAKHMYGQTISLTKRDEIIRSLKYPGLDLSIVRAAAARLWP